MYYFKKEFTNVSKITATPLGIEILKLEQDEFENLTVLLGFQTQFLLEILRKENSTSMAYEVKSGLTTSIFSVTTGNFVTHKIIVDLAYIYFVQNFCLSNREVKDFVRKESSNVLSEEVLDIFIEQLTKFAIPTLENLDFMNSNTNTSFTQTFYYIENVDDGTIVARERIK